MNEDVFFRGVLEEVEYGENDKVVNNMLESAAEVVAREHLSVIMIVLPLRQDASVVARWYAAPPGVTLTDTGWSLLSQKKPLRRNEKGVIWRVIDCCMGLEPPGWLTLVHDPGGEIFVVSSFDDPDVREECVPIIEDYQNGSSIYVPFKFSSGSATPKYAGILAADSKEKTTFRQGDIRAFFRSLASLVGVCATALHRSHYDSMCFEDGILGQGYLFDFMAKHFKTPESTRQHTVCFFDLNDFRTINTLHGHDVGDKAIRHFATQLYEEFSREMGDSAWAFRRGGDEFVLILRGCNVLDVIERLQTSFRNRVLGNPYRYPKEGNDIPVHLSTSCGIATGEEVVGDHGPWEAAASIDRLADQAMYFSKALRKSKVIAEDCRVIVTTYAERVAVESVLGALGEPEEWSQEQRSNVTKWLRDRNAFRKPPADWDLA